jgi:hypothetical protein
MKSSVRKLTTVRVLLGTGYLGGSLAAFVTATQSTDGPSAVAPMLIAGLAGGMALRALRVGVEIRGDQVIIREWLRTKKLARKNINAVAVVNYDGLISKGMTSKHLYIPQFRMDVGAVAARCLVGGRRAVLNVASDMAQQLEVSFDPCGDEWQSL